jgi:hypothetical protein
MTPFAGYTLPFLTRSIRFFHNFKPIREDFSMSEISNLVKIPIICIEVLDSHLIFIIRLKPFLHAFFSLDYSDDSRKIGPAPIFEFYTIDFEKGSTVRLLFDC